jgi:hypothetical protein
VSHGQKRSFGGFTSAANRRYLGAGADGYILGEKLATLSPVDVRPTGAP